MKIRKYALLNNIFESALYRIYPIYYINKFYIVKQIFSPNKNISKKHIVNITPAHLTHLLLSSNASL